MIGFTKDPPFKIYPTRESSKKSEYQASRVDIAVELCEDLPTLFFLLTFFVDSAFLLTLLWKSIVKISQLCF